MAVSQGTKNIKIWASNSGADKTAPDAASLDPTLTVADGWPSTFSAANGDTPRRAVFNWLFNAITSALVDLRSQGVLPWDTTVDTLAGGLRQAGNKLWIAKIDTGPTYNNSTNPTTDTAEAVWTELSASQAEPSAPTGLAGTSQTPGQLFWTWACPLDGGARVTSFNFRWRTAGATNWATITTTLAHTTLTGLTNGTAVEAQVRATNSIGNSPWSAVATATPAAQAPGGGQSLCLQAATAAQSQVATLDWEEPATNGAPITTYLIQWKTAAQDWSADRQKNNGITETQISPLTNNTEYEFRVRAVNSAGAGPWSDVRTATPRAPTPPPPADTAPNAPTNLTGTPLRPLKIRWTWNLSTNDGGQTITRYQFQWRPANANWIDNSTYTSNVTGTTLETTIPNTTNNIEARVRAENTVGSSPWSTVTTIASSALLGGAVPAKITRKTGTANYTWPYPDVSKAVLNIRSPQVGLRSDLVIPDGWAGPCATNDGTTMWIVEGGTAYAFKLSDGTTDSAKDITLPLLPAGADSEWADATSDGTTLWFAANKHGDLEPSQIYAYTAATRARDTTKDFHAPLAANSLGNYDQIGAVVAAGTTMWVLTRQYVRANIGETRTWQPWVAHGYNLSTKAYDTALNISVTPSATATKWRTAFTDGTTLYFIRDAAAPADAAGVAYNVGDRARNPLKDFLVTDTSDTGRKDVRAATYHQGYAWMCRANPGTNVYPDTVEYVFPHEAKVVVTGGAAGTHTADGTTTDDLTELTGLTTSSVFAVTGARGAAADLYPQPGVT